MRKLWKICKVILLAVLSIFILDILIVVFFSFYRPEIKKSDAIVVLGAAISTPSLYYRSLQGLKLYEQGDATVMVLSGGRISNKDISEALDMQKVIDRNSSTSVPTILEDQSHSTYENITFTKKKLGSGKSLIVVSDDFHLARSSLLAMREGFWPVYWSSPSPEYYNYEQLVFYYAREIFAMIDYIPKYIFG
jgi:uncharacterized SAM-binding protein YcdF (DUF218 family)